jgi:cytochrome c biogenesis protein CcmG/thiol:disulfide interchange protein DsbE
MSPIGKAHRLALALTAVALVALSPARGTATNGRPAPAFTLELLDGGTLSLADLKGSPVILLFWAPW